MMGYHSVVVSWVATVRLMYDRVMFWNNRMVGRKSVMLGMRMGVMNWCSNMMLGMRMNRRSLMMIVGVMMQSSRGMMFNMGRVMRQTFVMLTRVTTMGLMYNRVMHLCFMLGFVMST